jgi:pimeloyl-ACP methyl ester carboxylesterase
MTIATRAARLLAAALLAASALPAVAVAEPPAQTGHQAAPAFLQMDHISVQQMGRSGPPVILIPGLSSPREAWQGVAPELARSHRVFLVQVNGFGGDDPRANLRPGILAGIVADLRRLIRDQRLEAPAIVGHSMGGLVGLILAARHPDHVGRLMVVDALPYFGVLMAPPGSAVTVAMVEPEAARMRDSVASGYGRPADPAAIDANIAGMTLRPGNLPALRRWAAASDPRVAAQAMYEDLTTDIRPELAAIRAPVTIVHAWNQAFPGKDQAAAFFRREFAAVPGLTVAEVGESAHFVMLDQPEAFQAALAAFLR